MRFKKSTTIGNLELPQDGRAPAQDAGLPICDPCRPVDIYALTAEQWLAAEQMFQSVRHRAADMYALRDEYNSEPVDRSNWIWPKAREQRRYELLNEYDPQNDISLNYDSFPQAYSAWLAAFEAWAKDPQDCVRFETWLTLGRLVHMCADPMHRSTLDLVQDDRVGHNNRRIRWPRWLLGNRAVSRSSVPQDGKVDGQQTSGVSPLAGASSVRHVNSG